MLLYNFIIQEVEKVCLITLFLGANPQMLNSRLKNRLAYGGLGTIDLFKRTWKDLSEYINIIVIIFC